MIFKLFSIVLCKLGDLTGSNKLIEISHSFLDTLSKALTFQSISCDDYQKLIVCPTCHSTYEYDQCLFSSKFSANISAFSFICFPRHPHKRMQGPCSTPLLKIIKTSWRWTMLRPIKVFCYRSLVNLVVGCPAIFDLLSQWKSREIPNSVMADVYDGSCCMEIISKLQWPRISF